MGTEVKKQRMHISVTRIGDVVIKREVLCSTRPKHEVRKISVENVKEVCNLR